MPVFESSRKVQVFGSSLALTLPAMFVKVNEIEKGMSDCEDPEKIKRCLEKILEKLAIDAEVPEK
jgi:shikimate kinase